METPGRIPVIDKNKSKEFIEFLNRSGKTKEFWDEVKRGASTEVDKDELDELFESDKMLHKGAEAVDNCLRTTYKRKDKQ